VNLKASSAHLCAAIKAATALAALPRTSAARLVSARCIALCAGTARAATIRYGVTSRSSASRTVLR